MKFFLGRIRFCIFFLFLTTLIFSFAQESDSSDQTGLFFQSVDYAFENRSSHQLGQVLERAEKTQSFSRVEEYVMSKIRDLIIENDLEFARSASLELINANLENFDAVDIYVSLDRILANNQKEKK